MIVTKFTADSKPTLNVALELALRTLMITCCMAESVKRAIVFYNFRNRSPARIEEAVEVVANVRDRGRRMPRAVSVHGRLHDQIRRATARRGERAPFVVRRDDTCAHGPRQTHPRRRRRRRRRGSSQARAGQRGRGGSKGGRGTWAGAIFRIAESYDRRSHDAITLINPRAPAPLCPHRGSFPSARRDSLPCSPRRPAPRAPRPRPHPPRLLSSPR